MTLRWVPNAICALRIVLVVPLVASVLGGEYRVALVLLVLAGVSDGLDGFLAKTFGWQSRLGSLLDPAADKLLLVSAYVSLAYVGLVPVAVAAVVVGRDVVIIAGALAYQWLVAPLDGEPAAISKINTACQLGLLFFTLTSAAYAWPPEISLIVLGAAVVLTSIVSGLDYVLRWSRRAWRMTHPAA